MAEVVVEGLTVATRLVVPIRGLDDQPALRGQVEPVAAVRVARQRSLRRLRVEMDSRELMGSVVEAVEARI